MDYHTRQRKVRQSGPTMAQKAAYGLAASRACMNLGIASEDERKAYRRGVVKEISGCTSFALVRSNSDIDAIMARFWSDAGDYMKAADYTVNDTRQLAYLIKVVCIQLMQLKGGNESEARNYLEGLIGQSRTQSSGSALDIGYTRLKALFQMLDKERRKLVREKFPGFGTSLDDRVRYHVDGMLRIREGVPAGYYSSAPFERRAE